MQFLIATKNKGGILNVEKDCTKCENKVTDGVCCGSEENGLIDTTGEKKCFKPDFLARMEEEGKELEERLEKATTFLDSVNSKTPDEREEFFKKNDLDEGDLDLLQAQTTAMATYANILRIRFNVACIKRQLPTITRF